MSGMPIFIRKSVVRVLSPHSVRGLHEASRTNYQYFTGVVQESVIMVVTAVESQEAFKAALTAAGDKLVVVDFHATWCGPCKVIAPKIAAFSEQFTNVVFLKVDVDDVAEVAEEYAISAMPTFKYIKSGKVVGEVVGASEAKIKAEIEKLNC